MKPFRTFGGPSTELNAKWDALYASAYAKLGERIRDLEIPKPDRMPVQDLVVVYRIPNEYKGTLHIPEAFQGRHDSPYSFGVFMFAGCEAQDVLESHGVLPGDIVTFAKFAGQEDVQVKIAEAVENRARSQFDANVIAKDIRATEENKKKLLKLQVPQIHESVDLYDRLFGSSPTMERVRSVDKNGHVTHLIQPL